MSFSAALSYTLNGLLFVSEPLETVYAFGTMTPMFLVVMKTDAVCGVASLAKSLAARARMVLRFVRMNSCRDISAERPWKEWSMREAIAAAACVTVVKMTFCAVARRDLEVFGVTRSRMMVPPRLPFWATMSPILPRAPRRIIPAFAMVVGSV